MAEKNLTKLDPIRSTRGFAATVTVFSNPHRSAVAGMSSLNCPDDRIKKGASCNPLARLKSTA